MSSGEQVRDFTHVDDVAAGLIALERAPGGGTFNICSGEGHSLRRVAEELGSRLGDTSALQFGARPRAAHDLDLVVGDNSALKSLGWRPRHQFSSMIDATASYWQSR